MEFNPILGTGEFVVAGLNGELIGAKIAIEIVEGRAQTGNGRWFRRREMFSGARNSAVGQDSENQQEQSASEANCGQAVAPAEHCSGDGRSSFHDFILKISINDVLWTEKTEGIVTNKELAPITCDFHAELGRGLVRVAAWGAPAIGVGRLATLPSCAVYPNIAQG